MIHSCLTIVIKAMCDLMSDNHSYSTKVKGLVLLFTEERRLQDSCWKHLTDKNNRRENTIRKQKKAAPGGFVDSRNALTYLVSVG